MDGTLMDGRRAVVTGAGRGLGEAMARAFLRQGAAVVIADLDTDVCARTAKALADETGGVAVGIACDVVDQDSVRHLVAETASRLGGIDVWVNNAGILRNKSLADATLADFRDLIDVHVQGSWLGIKHVAPVMRADGGGSIINMSSIGGKAGLAGQTNYSTAKAAIVGLTKAAAKELAPDHIRVNTILPGIINTAMAAMLAPDDLAARIADIPLGRLGDPAEIGSAAVFLASDMSSYMTGALLEVSGGRFM
jgi:3-oxoacyl-[acyl-carrier protein] reductase